MKTDTWSFNGVFFVFVLYVIVQMANIRDAANGSRKALERIAVVVERLNSPDEAAKHE